ncbi:hypothetical protein U9Y00_24565 [Escherichia coli]
MRIHQQHPASCVFS